RHRAAGDVYPRKSEKDVRGGGLLARARGQGAGVSHRPQQLPRLRHGVEAVFQGAPAAHHHRLHRTLGGGYTGRDRPYRLRAAQGAPTRSHHLVVPRPLANYNEAFVIGDLVFAAGQLASDFKTGVPPEARKRDGFPFYGSDIELQTAYLLENLKKTFEAAGSSLDHVAKAQVFLTDLNAFHGFDSVWNGISRCLRRAPRSAARACWSKTRWWRSTLSATAPGLSMRSSRRLPVRSRTTARDLRWAATFSRPVRSRATIEPAFRRRRASRKVFRSTARTSSCRRHTSSTT